MRMSRSKATSEVSQGAQAQAGAPVEVEDHGGAGGESLGLLSILQSLQLDFTHLQSEF